MAIKNSSEYAAPAAACAADILLYMAQAQQPQSLAAVARAVDCSSSLAFRVTRELERRKLLTKEAGGFRLGLAALEIGAAVAARHGYLDIAREMLSMLAQETGETVNLGVLRGPEVLILLKEDSPVSVVTISHIGARLPANCSALGKLLLSELDDQEVVKRFDGHYPRLTSKSTADAHRLLEEIAMIRRDGYAFDYEGAILGRCGIAVPLELVGVEDEHAALAVTASTDHFDSRREVLLRALLEAREIYDRARRARQEFPRP